MAQIQFFTKFSDSLLCGQEWPDELQFNAEKFLARPTFNRNYGILAIKF